MTLRRVIAIIILSIVSTYAFAQSSVTYTLSPDLDGTVLQVPAEGLHVNDDGGNGSYSSGIDWSVTLSDADLPCSAPYVLGISFTQFDIHPLDTLFIYDGPSTAYPLIVAANNNYNNLSEGRNTIYASRNNSSNLHAITIRFKTANHTVANAGFFCNVGCFLPCERIEPHIDSVFDRTRGGVVFGQGIMRTIDGQRVIPVCAGEGVIVHGYATYTRYTDHYTPTDASSRFTWTFDGRENTVGGVGMTEVAYPFFDTLACHEIVLDVTDRNGCEATVFDQVQLRVSTNPIRTISNLGTVCFGDELVVQVSYDANALISVDSVAIHNIHTRTNYVKTFIPDGPNCDVLCYSAPVTFTEFPAGATLESKDDICSICVNFEHSYMGDYDLNIICPSGRTATLKYKEDPGDAVEGSYGGGGMFTGYPYGGDEHDMWDGVDEKYCDSIYNMYGIGLDYCFSRNANYTLVDGLPANTTEEGSHYLANDEYTDAVTISFPPLPAEYRVEGLEDAGSYSFSTKRASNHAARSNYYKPADDFSSLVGCPLNGTWKIQICDEWSIDNGWVFGWSMDICNISTGDDCEYNVSVDSVTWDITPEAGRSNAGVLRRDTYDPMRFYMSANDTAGLFYAKMHVYDDFGCRWDSTGHFTVLWTPEPRLGDDVTFCEEGAAVFNALDRHSGGMSYTYSYLWSTGDTIPVIRAHTDTSRTYWVRVSNMATNGDTAVCIGTDTVRIMGGIHPQAMFGPDDIGIACEPYALHFENQSLNASSFSWDFGDGTTSDRENPVHTYKAGRYTVTLYATSDDGCIDTLVVRRYVEVNAAKESVQKAMICEGGEYTWKDGVTYYEPTSEPTVMMLSSQGCDSIIHLNLGLDKTTQARIHAIPEIATPEQTEICLFDHGINSERSTWWLPDGKIVYKDQTCFEFPSDEDSVRVILAIESPYGCKDTTSMVIRMDKSQLWMPNVFTPLAPNNRTFKISSNDVDQVDFSIFNRFGQMVFQTTDKYEGWDGTHNGTPCQQGVYVYIVRYTTNFDTDRWLLRRGTVTLLR
ncbi:MAG: gliding motility-associated C-terminal domain-containing protein [Bacteroidales bacterium]|nr:gliding motility-associated C-terminal domain-containing protein [Bacteroidales bacterium]